MNNRYQDVTADAGYESEENYTYFENKKQKCYIKSQNYERSKTRKFKTIEPERSFMVNFRLNQTKNE